MANLLIDSKLIKVNGYSSLGSFAEKHKAFVESAVALYRLRHDDESILNSFPADDYHLGSRFNSNDSVAERLLSAVASHIHYLLHLSSNNEEAEASLELEIDHFFENVKGSDLDYLINESMRDCASADHWYTFEKIY
jgi:hypothetical protein